MGNSTTKNLIAVERLFDGFTEGIAEHLVIEPEEIAVAKAQANNVQQVDLAAELEVVSAPKKVNGNLQFPQNCGLQL